MSTTTVLHFDSTTPAEAYDLTLAFPRTARAHTLPAQLTDQPTVKVGGMALGWTSPRLTFQHAEALLAEFRCLQGLMSTDSPEHTCTDTDDETCRACLAM
jgi:hypothetical protein